LDSESEKIVSDALGKLIHGRTVITISHRLNTILTADKIVVIKEGRVVEEGTHQSLLDKGGVYAELYKVYDSKKSSYLKP
jgi:ABC-type multidrug transport system fused ATPase/permease subunit